MAENISVVSYTIVCLCGFFPSPQGLFHTRDSLGRRLAFGQMITADGSVSFPVLDLENMHLGFYHASPYFSLDVTATFFEPEDMNLLMRRSEQDILFVPSRRQPRGKRAAVGVVSFVHFFDECLMPEEERSKFSFPAHGFRMP